MQVWEALLAKLENYYQEQGHWEVTFQEDIQLAQWVENLRASKEKLPSKLYQQLLEIGFPFESPVNWQRQYEQLKSFVTRFGHAYVPAQVEEYSELFNWVVRQRQVKNKLSPEQLNLLDQLGFEWEQLTSKQSRWEFMFERLKAFQQQHGHVQVTMQHQDEYGIATWVHNIRSRAHRLSAQQKERLTELGFLWQGEYAQQQEAQWQAHYEALRQYRQQYGHTQVPIKWKENRKLSVWVSEQRLRHKAGKLDQTRKQLLDQIDFLWSEDIVQKEEAHWQQMYEQLILFKKERGHCRVASTEKQHKDLAFWVQSQRILHKRGLLSQKKMEQLETIGFAWANTIRPTHWEKMYQQLQEYNQQHRHVNVPQQEGDALGAWVQAQRQKYKQGKLSQDQIKKLEALGFQWQDIQRENNWRANYQALEAYYQKHGHLQVEAAAHPQLYRWMGKQRQRRKKKSISKRQIQLLDKLGFSWSEDLQKQRQMQWQQRYEQLLAFKHQHQHLKVPELTYKQLAGWVHKQRQKYKAGKLPKEYQKKLEAIGFQWQVYRTNK